MKIFYLFILVSSFCFSQQKVSEIYTKNLIDSMKRFSWNEKLKIWETKELTINKYDQDLNKNGETKYKYSEVFAKYIPVEKTELFYSNNLISQSIVSFFDEKLKTWMKNEYTDFAYNSANKEEKTIIYKYDKQIKNWIQKSKTEFYYSSSKLKDSALTLYYDIKNEKWEFNERIVYNYDQSNKLVNQLRSLFDVKLKMWTQFSNTLQKNNLQISQYWIDSSSIWAEKTKNISTYFADKNITERIYFNWNKDSKSWDNATKIEYYYSRKNIIPQKTENEVEDKNKIKVYPNPTFGKIMFDNLNNNCSLKIVNLSGEEVMFIENVQSRLEIDLSLKLKPGVYFIETIQDNNIERVKFILQ